MTDTCPFCQFITGEIKANILFENQTGFVVRDGYPAYYCKTGFQSITEDIIQAPLKLSMPIGWLAQSLTEQPLQSIKGKTQCVGPLNDQRYW